MGLEVIWTVKISERTGRYFRLMRVPQSEADAYLQMIKSNAKHRTAALRLTLVYI